MKTQITKILKLDCGRYMLDGRLAICGSFIQAFFPGEELPEYIKVSVSIRSWAFKGAKKIWVRHQHLAVTKPSSWTWTKDGNFPNNFEEGGGMYEVTSALVRELLGEKMEKLSPSYADASLNPDNFIPLYVQVEKLQKITKRLTLGDCNDYWLDDGSRGLCPSFVQKFFPGEQLPVDIDVTISMTPLKGAKRIWLRHSNLGRCSPSSWTWEKNGNKPDNFTQGSGMYVAAATQVKLLLGDQFGKLSTSSAVIPLYVRVTKI